MALKASQYQLLSSETKILLQQSKLLSKMPLTCDPNPVKSFYCYSCLLIMTAICVQGFFFQIRLLYFYFLVTENACCTQCHGLSFVPFVVLWFITHQGIFGQKEKLESGLQHTHFFSWVTSDNTRFNLACPWRKFKQLWCLFKRSYHGVNF